MKSALLTYLVCPTCQDPLDCEPTSCVRGEIEEGTLRCPRCQRRYAIHKGIPRFTDQQIHRHDRTSAAFGYEWRMHPELAPYHEQQFLEWILPVTPEFFRGKIVLDAGCGKGRHVALAARYGAREVIGVDVSAAIEVASANLRQFPNVHLLQADLRTLPLRKEFDYIYSIGVLHHLPHPQEGFAALIRHLKPGGAISVWVYAREGNEWLLRWINPSRRYVAGRLPRPLLYRGAVLLALPVYAWVRLRYRRPSTDGFYGSYLSSLAGYPLREVHHIIFDQLNAPIAHYVPREEVGRWLTSSSLRETTVSWHHKNSWRGFGIRASD